MADTTKTAYRAVVSPLISQKAGEYSSDPVCLVGHGINFLAGGSEISYPKSEHEGTPAGFLQF